MKRFLEITLGLSWIAAVGMAWVYGDFVPGVLWLLAFAYYLMRYNGGFDMVRELIEGFMGRKA